MELTITIPDGVRVTAITRALAAYNLSNPQAQLNPSQFIEKLVLGQADNLVASYVVTKVSRLAFLERFTPAERVAIRTAAQTSVEVEDYLQMLSLSDEVDLTYPTTVAGVNQLEASGLIAVGRASEILAL